MNNSPESKFYGARCICVSSWKWFLNISKWAFKKTISSQRSLNNPLNKWVIYTVLKIFSLYDKLNYLCTFARLNWPSFRLFDALWQVSFWWNKKNLSTLKKVKCENQMYDFKPIIMELKKLDFVESNFYTWLRWSFPELFSANQVKGGPMMRLVLKAEVTQPNVELSDDVIDFGEVCCGQCKIVSIQLHNHTAVNSDWYFSPPQLTRQNKDKVSAL